MGANGRRFSQSQQTQQQQQQQQRRRRRQQRRQRAVRRVHAAGVDARRAQGPAQRRLALRGGGDGHGRRRALGLGDDLEGAGAVNRHLAEPIDRGHGGWAGRLMI